MVSPSYDGYRVLQRTQLDLAGLCRPHGRYWYNGGWSLSAVAATLAGGLLAVGGAYSAPGQGPFPAGGLIPVLKGLYDYSWVVGFVAGFLIYMVLAPLSARARASGATALSTAPQ